MAFRFRIGLVSSAPAGKSTWLAAVLRAGAPYSPGRPLWLEPAPPTTAAARAVVRLELPSAGAAPPAAVGLDVWDFGAAYPAQPSHRAKWLADLHGAVIFAPWDCPEDVAARGVDVAARGVDAVTRELRGLWGGEPKPIVPARLVPASPGRASLRPWAPPGCPAADDPLIALAHILVARAGL